jgi:pyruvate/2-oxoglutarate dehydrogenase complex dihydrolipoamide acyltransferase (E2) component
LNSDVLATPYVRGLIKKHGLDALKIKGSGEGGRILEADVDHAMNGKHHVKAHKQEKREDKHHKPAGEIRVSEVKKEVPRTVSHIANSA